MHRQVQTREHEADTRTAVKLMAQRFERFAKFGLVGGLGTVLNLAIMALVMQRGVHYIVASVIAIEVTIVTNFLLQERFVFTNQTGGRSWSARFVRAFGFNNAEALLKVPALIALVEVFGLHELVAQAAVLITAFLLRFSFTSRVIYRVPLFPRH
jgi:dolichol-phosphate mannosyltransferase